MVSTHLNVPLSSSVWRPAEYIVYVAMWPHLDSDSTRNLARYLEDDKKKKIG